MLILQQQSTRKRISPQSHEALWEVGQVFFRVAFGVCEFREHQRTRFPRIAIGVQVPHRVAETSPSRVTPSKLVGRYGALLPLFRLVGVLCIAALWRVKKPTASPQRSPETEFVGPKEGR
jgi:hypothetical protein